MIRQVIRAAALVAASAWTAAATAAGPVSVGVSVGEADAEDFCRGTAAAGISCDDTDTGLRVFLGTDINPNFRIEGFWVDFGEVKASDSSGNSVTIESDGIGIAALGVLTASERFDVFGKLGLLAWDADLETNFGFSDSDDGTDPFFGAGARYWISDAFALRGEGEEFELDDADVSLLSISGELRF